MAIPTPVTVSDPPDVDPQTGGTGKTTLARRRAADLELPLIKDKIDDIKERLFDQLGIESVPPTTAGRPARYPARESRFLRGW